MSTEEKELSQKEKRELLGKILTSNKEKDILKVSIREFRNNFSVYWKLVSAGKVVVVYNRKVPALIVSPYTK